MPGGLPAVCLANRPMVSRDVARRARSGRHRGRSSANAPPARWTIDGQHVTIGPSVRETGRVVFTEEGPKTSEVGVEIAAGIVERFPGDRLSGPP